MGGGGGRGGGAEVRWWRRWPGRAGPALRCSELGAEALSLALSGSLARWLAPRSLTARRPALALPTRGGGKRRPGAAPPTAHARRASVCMCARARARLEKERARRGRARREPGASSRRWAALHGAGHAYSGVPVSPATSRGRRSRGGPGDVQPRKKPGGAGPTPPPPASFPPFSSASSSLFFLLLSFRSSCLASSSPHLPPPTPASLFTLCSFWDGSSVQEEPGTGLPTPPSLAGT